LDSSKDQTPKIRLNLCTGIGEKTVSDERHDTYPEREVQCEPQACKVDCGEWQPLFRHQVFDVVYWSNENGESRGLYQLDLAKMRRNESHPNMTSRLPKLR